MMFLTSPDEILFTHNNYQVNCASSYFYLKEYKLCETHLNQIQLDRLIKDNSRLLPSIYSLKACFYFVQQDIEKTLENCKLAIDCLNTYFNSLDIFLSLCKIAELLLEMDMDDMASDLLIRLKKMIEHESYSERSESLYSLMVTYYKKTNQVEQLKQTYKSYYELKQSSIKESIQTKRLFMKTFLEFQQQRTITERINQKKESFQALSQTDSLTGLPNRLAFNQYSSTTFADCVGNQHLFAIIIIDLDNFKAVNDSYGHLAGDHVLQSIGTIFLNHTSDNCYVSRYGGDEFIAVCKNLSELSIKELTNIIHSELNTLTFPFVPEYRTITCSMGASLSIPTKQQSITDYIRIADRALYKQKQHGKNGTHIITTI